MVHPNITTSNTNNVSIILNDYRTLVLLGDANPCQCSIMISDKTEHTKGNTTVNTLTDNILKVYDAATDADRIEGSEWYPVANQIATTLHDNIDVASAVIAALSPRMPWERNIECAREVIDTGTTKCLGNSLRKALTALTGNLDGLFDKATSKKTKNFWMAIANPLGKNNAVIDIHALGVALGRRASESDYNDLKLVGAYEFVADSYMMAAIRRGVHVNVMQATTWVTWRKAL